MPYTPNAIVLEAFSFEADTFTRYISGITTQVAADIIGHAVALDATAAGTVKLAGDGDYVYGRVYQYEDRKQEGVKTVSVERRFVKRLPKTAAAIAIGATVVGAGAGLVKAAVSPDQNINTVIFVDETLDYVVVEKL